MKENQEDLRANFIEQLCWCFKNFRGSFQEESICIFLILIRFALESLVQFFVHLLLSFSQHCACFLMLTYALHFGKKTGGWGEKRKERRDICRGSGTLEQMNTSTGREATQ